MSKRVLVWLVVAVVSVIIVLSHEVGVSGGESPAGWRWMMLLLGAAFGSLLYKVSE